MDERARLKRMGLKPVRNRELMDMWETGEYTYAQLGEEFGITRQRAYQIVQQFRTEEDDERR